MIKPDLNKPAWQWFTLVILSFFWGSSFILMKKGLQSFSHGQVAAFRIFFSFLLFLPFGYQKLKKMNRNNWRSLFLVAIIGNSLPAFLFTKAQTQIPSSLAGILNSLAPLFTLIIGVVFYKSKTRWINVLGVVLGLFGATGLIIADPSALNNWRLENMNIYGLFVVLATICYGLNTNEIKYKIKGLKGFEITVISFLIAGPLAGIYLLFSDFSGVAETENYMINLGYVFLLALFSSVTALSIFYTLIQYVQPVFATSVTYIIPIFAIMWGIIDGEQIVPAQFLFIGAILFGVYLVTKKDSNKKTYPVRMK
jgi:drug/metabolite transporter (DMT)-like permease